MKVYREKKKGRKVADLLGAPGLVRLALPLLRECGRTTKMIMIRCRVAFMKR